MKIQGRKLSSSTTVWENRERKVSLYWRPNLYSRDPNFDFLDDLKAIRKTSRHDVGDAWRTAHTEDGRQAGPLEIPMLPQLPRVQVNNPL
ncbi:MAG: hypothetical protein U0V70_00250 [Terriglobia bacterium]